MDLRSLVRRSAAPLVLEVDLTGGLLTQAPGDPLTALRQRNTPLLRDVLDGLRRATRDDRVVAALVLGGADLSAAQADEIGIALDHLRAAGTATYAHASTFGELTAGTVPYALAARCAQVWLQPTGYVGITGLSTGLTLVRGALERLGVEPQFGQRHEYKTAADLFAAHEVSEANREMSRRLVASVSEQLAAVIAQHRGLAPERVTELIARAPLSGAEALEAGLVDRLGYRDELDAALRDAHGEVELLFAHRYARKRQSAPAEQLRRRRAPVIALVPVHGAIVEGRSRHPGPGPVGPRAGALTVTAALRSAAENDRVKAVVVHVESPGGSAVASDAIRRAVLQVRASGRPVVAAMGSVAASGGYFAAMPAERIFALPTTITGSIGVLAGKLVIEGLVRRTGIVRELVASAPNATFFSPEVGFSDAQRAQLERWLDDIYSDFTAKAAHDRGMALEVLEPLARGRVWTGADAHERGLVDELGGGEAAIAHACHRAGIERETAAVVAWPPLGLVERLQPADSTHAPAAALTAPGGLDGWLAACGDALGLPAGVLALPFPPLLR